MLKKLINVFAAVSIAAAASLNAYAAPDENSVAYVQEDGELRIICEDNSGALSNVRWEAYLIGSRHYDDFVFTDAFKPLEITGTQDAYIDGVGIDMTRITDKDVENVVGLFQDYIEDKKIECNYTFVTDNEGLITETLPNGMYLLVMDGFERDERIWTAAPALIEVNGEWYEDGTEVYPKISSKPVDKPESPPKTGYTKEVTIFSYAAVGIVVLIGAVLVIRRKHKNRI